MLLPHELEMKCRVHRLNVGKDNDILVLRKLSCLLLVEFSLVEPGLTKNPCRHDLLGMVRL